MIILKMAGKLLFRTVFDFNHGRQLAPKILASVQVSKIHTNNEVPVKEITIPVPWGHIAAKLWGTENERPILALHGWQDNAGTWDPLAPMISKDRPVLAIDFPGHGLSSWIPPGMYYCLQWDLPRLILTIKEHYKWDKVSLLGHSMGSIAAFRVASLFTEEVDFYIAIENLFYDDYDLDKVIDNYGTVLQKIAIAQTRLTQEPSAYALEELYKIWHLGTHKSVKYESVKYLTIRGTKVSKKDPTKYCLSRDPRLKNILFTPEEKKSIEGFAEKLKCPTLYIKALGKPSSPSASDSLSVYIREYLEKNNERFESQFVPGTHHLHLNNPETVYPLIQNFLIKHKFI